MRHLTFVLFLTACGSGGTEQPIDASSEETNHLGELCNVTNDTCPATTTCRVFNSVGDPENGFCAPDCTDPTTCTTDYTGPESGVPECFQDYCVVTCALTADCPLGLECISTGGPTTICAQPQ